MSGKTVLVTGASRGIGAATALAFAKAGANLVLGARGIAETQALADEIGPRARAVACDVADCDQVAAAVGTAVSAYGGLDVMMNNAGAVEPVSRLADSDPAAWGRVIDVNLKGVYHGIRAALPVMLEAGGGTVINISSGAATSPVEGWSHYCASKAGVLMLTRMLHHEYGDQGIRSIGLSPGTVATQMQREIRASGINPVSRLDWSAHIPPEWPAHALLWLCGDGGDAWLGKDVSLRDPAIRRAVGLID